MGGIRYAFFSTIIRTIVLRLEIARISRIIKIHPIRVHSYTILRNVHGCIRLIFNNPSLIRFWNRYIIRL